MSRCGANTTSIDRFLAELRQGTPVRAALAAVRVAACIQRFVSQTFDIVESGSFCAIASAFTFGREDLLPELFQRIVDALHTETDCGLEDFCYYLHRHIGLDGQAHGPLAGQFILSLCGSDEARWQEAEQAAVASLEARRQLWDGVYAALQRQRDGVALPPKGT
jgi:Protein of unknown function (DUF3050)